MYQYWTQCFLEEHMLFCGEIAEIYHIKTRNGKNATSLVRAILSDHMESNYLRQQYYFITRNGPADVYPYAIYHKAITNFIISLNLLPTDHYCNATIAGKEYNFIINKD